MVSITKNRNSESSDVPKVNFSDPTVLKTGFSRILGLTTVFIDYVVGMIMGAIGGSVIGYCLGHIFLDMFEPARLESFEAIRYWYYLPLSFGYCGALIAAGISVPVVYFLAKRRMRYRMAKCYKLDELEKYTEEIPAHTEAIQPNFTPCKAMYTKALTN